ncbi:AAA family ATPase [Paenibacillus sediminis]|uniref:AAA family ATPase n=1 Tax=Paenibacillus sediminis TaxID=664909 RepID=UPI001AE224D7
MTLLDHQLYVKRAELLHERITSYKDYPFHIPAVRYLEQLSFTRPVTFIVGENGSGKSTLLEAIAIAWGFNAEGGTLNYSFETQASHSNLHEYIRLARGVKRPKDGFFFRAESYYNVASYVDRLDEEPAGGRRVIESYGGKSLHAQSHGESFFSTFLNRFGGKGLYVMDEPEAALSPVRQLSMLKRMHELVQRDSQFIIATHSPILMAYPNAEIWQFYSDRAPELVEWEDTEHYIVTRKMMTERERMLQYLFDDEYEPSDSM